MFFDCHFFHSDLFWAGNAFLMYSLAEAYDVVNQRGLSKWQSKNIYSAKSINTFITFMIQNHSITQWQWSGMNNLYSDQILTANPPHNFLCVGWTIDTSNDIFSLDLQCGWKQDLLSLIVCNFTLNTPHALLSASSIRLALDMRILRKQKSQAWNLLGVKYVLGIKGCHQPNPGWVRITLSKTGPTINRI